MLKTGMNKLQFFTDITTNVSNLCLLHIDKYQDSRKYNKLQLFVDPGVHSLMKFPEYPKIDLLHKLASNPSLMGKNEHISIDYPGDMFPERTAEFIERTFLNNLKYKYNEQYICTIQFHLSNCGIKTKTWISAARGDLSDFASFKHNFERVELILKNPNKILGIGNICRIMHTNPLLDSIFNYIISKKPSITNKIHLYGPALRIIKKYVPLLQSAGFEVSVDSTKWTRAVNNELKYAHGVCCRKNTRDLYFMEYIKHIEKHNIKVIF